MSHNHSESCHDYIKCLEEERSKIQAFQRELPLCLDLVNRAIESCKGQLSGSSNEFNLQGEQVSECSEQTSSFVPVLEEFIPLKRASNSDSDGEEQESYKKTNKDGEDDSSDQSCKKSEWLRSVQLWNQTPDPICQEVSASKFCGTEVKISESGAFHPFRKEKSPFIKEKSGGSAPPPSTGCTAETGCGNKKEVHSQRKARRSWSPELHRRFLQALKQLGGPHVATPKQIREFMKVDGLTNDEVKSHLQKYRLHTRRPSPSTSNNTQITPQFVVVGGIWVPPEYAANAMATTTTSAEAPASNKIYAPVAAPPQPFQHVIKQSSQSCSLASSSSIHTYGRRHTCLLIFR